MPFLYRVVLASHATLTCLAVNLRKPDLKNEGVACKQDDDCPFEGASYMRCCPISGQAPGCPDSGLVAKQKTPTAKCTLPGFFGENKCTCTKPPKCISEGPHWGWPYAQAKTGKKQWLMIGDSISYQGFNGLFTLSNTTELGYQVFHIPDNGKNVWWGAHCLDEWLGDDPTRWDLITFNFGLHDLALTNERVEPAEYGKLLAQIAQRLVDKAPQALLLYADTTPVPLGSDGPCDISGGHEQGGCPPRRPQDVLVYNKAANDALASFTDASKVEVHQIGLYNMVVDQCGAAYETCPGFQLSRSVHFDKGGILALGVAYLDSAHAAVQRTTMAAAA